MRLLVTGGAGFIGSNFVRYWLAGHPDDTVVNLDALTYAGNPENIRGLDEQRHTFIHGSICDPETVRRAMDGIDVVVNFAAETHVDRSIKDSRPFLETNIFGTHVLLEEARRRGDRIKRFHQISTDEVFGALPLEGGAFDERTPYHPRNPYSATKAAANHLCRAYHETYGVPVTVSYCSNNYGPYLFPEKFIPLMIVNAIRDVPLPIYGDGLYRREWIHVEDHCRGIEAILLQGNAGQSYGFGGGVDISNLEVAHRILDRLGKPKSLVTHVEDRQGHDRRYAIDASKARRELNWTPRIPFDEGLNKMIDWYREHKTWWQPLL